MLARRQVEDRTLRKDLTDEQVWPPAHAKERDWCSLIKEYSHSDGSQCAPGGVFKHLTYLLRRYARKPSDKPASIRTRFEIFEERRNGDSSVAKQPRTAYALGIPLNSGARTPVNHLRPYAAKVALKLLVARQPKSNSQATEDGSSATFARDMCRLRSALRPLGEQTEVLFHELAVFFRHLVTAGEKQLVLAGAIQLAAQREFEAL